MGWTYDIGKDVSVVQGKVLSNERTIGRHDKKIDKTYDKTAEMHGDMKALKKEMEGMNKNTALILKMLDGKN